MGSCRSCAGAPADHDAKCPTGEYQVCSSSTLPAHATGTLVDELHTEMAALTPSQPAGEGRLHRAKVEHQALRQGDLPRWGLQSMIVELDACARSRQISDRAGQRCLQVPSKDERRHDERRLTDIPAGFPGPLARLMRGARWCGMQPIAFPDTRSSLVQACGCY
jgi:hypothetical protein